MTRIYLLYCLSGFLSLAYQVAWYRIYVDRFGATNLTFALVLCNFILGLAAGGLASRWVVERLSRRTGINDRLRLYGVLELCVGAAVFLTVLTQFVPATTWGTFPYALSGELFWPRTAYELSKILLAMMCVFVPCFFMGTTFPLLCYVYRDSDRFPSALYAWNTLGACTGVIVCQFVFIQYVGHDRTLWVTAVVNLLLGGYFVLTGGAPTVTSDSPPERAFRADSSAAATVLAAGGFAVPLLLAFLSGLLSGALEGDMFKRIGFLGGHTSAVMSFISFWAILAIFLASWAVRTFRWIDLDRIKYAAVLSFACYLGAWHFAYPVRAWFENRVGQATLVSHPELQYTERGITVHFPSSMFQSLLDVGMFVFPAFFFISLLFPYVCNRVQAARRHLGLIYGINTMAFCAGILAFTHIAPRVNIFYSLRLIFVLLAVGIALLVTITEDRQLQWWKPWAAASVFVVGCFLTPASFNKSYVYPGSPASQFPIRALKSNGAHTTYVVEDPRGDILYFDTHAMSAAARGGQVYMRLMAHFPLFAQPRILRKALLICFGVGNTASAIAAHDTITQIDMVDLNDKVFETAPEFDYSNDEVYLDPRARLIVDDGRTFLELTDEKYDLITSEPPPPMHPGVYRLYSQEFYEQALAHLTPGGMMTQWLPTYQMPPQAVDLAVSTFVNVFEHTLMFAGQSDNFILVGSPGPIDVTRIEQRFDEQEKVVADLRNLASPVNTPTELLARVVQGDAGLRRRYAGKPVISDQRNELSHLYADPGAPAVVEYDPLEMLDDIGATQLQGYDQLRSIVTDLSRLQYVVKDFPADTLAAVTNEQVAHADVDWQKVRWLQQQFDQASRAGQYPPALEIAKQMQLLADPQPDLLLRLARLHLRNNRHEEALSILRDFNRLMPEAGIGYSLMGSTRMRMNQLDRARPVLEKALSLSPSDASVHFNLGRIDAARGNLETATERFREAVRLKPDVLQYRAVLGELLAKQGQLPAALAEIEAALKLDPDNLAVQQLKAKLEAAQRWRGGQEIRLDGLVSLDALVYDGLEGPSYMLFPHLRS